MTYKKGERIMKSLIMTLAILMYATGLYAETIVSGPVTGIWTVENHPYIVSNHIDPTGVYVVDSLVIHDGVIVQFDAGLSLAVGEGDKFVAKGVAGNPIVFEGLMVHQPGAWDEISIVNSSNDDTLEYCDIRDANTGIYIYNSTILINYCNIYGNAAYGVDFNYYVYNSDSSMIANCSIYDNLGNAGLRLYVSVSTYYHSAIASLKIFKSTIFNNAGNGVLISASTGYYNGTANARGRITNCTISNNDSTGVMAYGPSGVSDATITNSIMTFNGGYGVANLGSGYINPDDIIHSCFWGNQLSDFNNIAGEGFGENGPYENINGDSRDVNLNIYNDPIFADLGNRDYQITWENHPIDDSTRSHCIDAGTSIIYGEFVLDPDDTTPDMGAMYFHQPTTRITDDKLLPFEFHLRQNYPNPFNPTTTVNYLLPTPADVRLDIYNLLGQRVVTLFEGRQEAGEHTVTWDASGFPSGVYFARLETAERSESIKMLFLK